MPSQLGKLTLLRWENLPVSPDPFPPVRALAELAHVRLLPQWAIVDSNHGPPPYQSGALTN
jgi:hypothetical protein